MEVYVAVRGHQPTEGDRQLWLRKGDRLEVLEEEAHRHHREWWGVRRLCDQALGYVPRKCLKFDESIPGHLLNEDYEHQKSLHIRQLDSMQQEEDLPLPDPSIDPLPDYYLENDVSEQDGGPAEGRWNNLVLDIGEVPKKDNGLTEEEWNKILASAEEDFPDPPANVDIPEPDYGEEDSTEEVRPIVPHPESQIYQAKDEPALISPRKIPNPCLQSRERIRLHKELLQNKKMGINVLSRKSELRRTLDKREEDRKRKEMEEYLKSKKTVFEKKLEEQATKLQEYEELQKKKINGSTNSQEDDKNVPEFIRVHSKINKKMAPS